MSGPFGSTAWMANPASGFYGFPITNSLRFEDGDSAYLSYTPGAAGNQRTWTYSLWAKKCKEGASQDLLLGNASGDLFFEFQFTDADDLQVFYQSQTLLVSDAKLRDSSAWYHIVVRHDTTQGTANNRLRFYLNGAEVTSFSTNGRANVPLNFQGGVNSAVAHHIGANQTPGNYYDGYLAEINFIDGTSLGPDSFGETKNDIWIPKDTAGLTFGDEGYRLQFKQSGTSQNSSGIGADTSGNDNHWAVNNLVASDVMPDSPTNNFATMNPLDVTDANVTYSEGNLKTTTTSGGNAATAESTIAAHGKVYAEFLIASSVSSAVGPFVGNMQRADSNEVIFYISTGKVYNPDENTGYATFADGDLLSIAYDAVNKRVWFGKNNTYIYGNPANGTDGLTNANLLGEGNVALGVSDESAGSVLTVHHNFGQNGTFNGTKTAQGNADENGIGDFFYAPPSGFLAMCTANLPDPVATIDPAKGGSPQDYFNTVLYTGNGATTHAISGVGFQPDWVWGKVRSKANTHWLFDSVRGATEQIESDTTSAESTQGTMLKTFDSDGFSMGNDGPGNENTQTFVAWNWKAGTAFSNDASSTGVGSLDSTGSVSADTGFSIISYTGNATSGATVAHGLSSAPQLLLIKNRATDGRNWESYFTNPLDGSFDYIYLNLTAAKGNMTVANPTTSVFTLGGGGDSNAAVATIAYCFHSVDGFSKFGGYTGNGNADGTFVYTGFRPAFVLIKSISAVESWNLFDTARDPSNLTTQNLNPNVNNAESDASSGARALDILSNGFKLRGANSAVNSGTFIYMAFAEQPFKYANAR